VLSESLEASKAKAQAVYERGQWPRFYFSKQGQGGIARKTYLENVGGKLPTNFWPHSDAGHTDEAKKEMLSIFTGITTFDTPKPTRLIERIFQISTNPGDIILDSFAGSGTTAHAALKSGDRRFILVEMEEYAETITAERVRRVIDGYGDVPGTGGSFEYYELGEPLMFANGNLNEAVDTAKIREYVWYMETKQSAPETSAADNPYLLGVTGGAAYYFHYEKDAVTTLDTSFLASIKTQAERYVIYADQCALPDETLNKYNITFKKIPRDIAKL
jgi:adenine-specific DNA-methyltransferase